MSNKMHVPFLSLVHMGYLRAPMSQIGHLHADAVPWLSLAVVCIELAQRNCIVPRRVAINRYRQLQPNEYERGLLEMILEFRI